MEDQEPLGGRAEQRVAGGSRCGEDFVEAELEPGLVHGATQRLHQQLSAQAQTEDRQLAGQGVVDRASGTPKRGAVVDRVGKPG